MQNISKTLLIAALVSALGFGAQTLAADNCAVSFYCYGNSSAHVSSTPTRPAPLPPPNPNYIHQRHQAQLALHNNRPPRAPLRQPVPMRQVTRPVHAMPASAARVTVIIIPSTHNPAYRPVPHPPAQPAPANTIPRPHNAVATCQISRQRLLARATELERLAVLDAKRGQRQRSAAQFRDASRMRSNAQHMNCR
jgi:hypothetical protein